MHLTPTLLTFQQLTTDDLYDIILLRQEIFIVEQKCPYMDVDGKDKYAHHLLLRNTSNTIICYARILPPNISYPGYSSIGRVVCKQKERGHGYGLILMNLAISYCKELFPVFPIKIGAQSYLKDFYTSLGFTDSEIPYIEDDIPHIIMTMK